MITISKHFGVVRFQSPFSPDTIHLVGIDGSGFGEQVPDFFACYNFRKGEVYSYAEEYRHWSDGGSGSGKYYNLEVIDIDQITDQITVTYREYGYGYGIGAIGNPIPGPSFDSIGAKTYTYNVNDDVNAYNNTLVRLPEFDGFFADQKAHSILKLYKTEQGETGKHIGTLHGWGRDYPYDGTQGLLIKSEGPNAREDLFQEVEFLYLKKRYEPGLGRVLLSDDPFESREHIELVGYTLNGDTIGTVFNEVDLISSTQFLSENIEAKVYPNPFKDQLSVELSGISQSQLSVKLYDLSGREVFAQKLNELNHTLELPTLTSGIYFLHLISERGTTTFKLIRSD